MAYEGWDGILQRRYDYGSDSGQQNRRQSIAELRAAQQRRLDELASGFRRSGSSARLPNFPDLPAKSSWTSPFAQGATTSLRNQADTAQALGVWDEVKSAGTEAFGGILNSAVNVLDSTRGAGMGFVTGGLNFAGQLAENAGIDNPLDEWTANPYDEATNVDDYQDLSFGNSPFGRAISGFTNDKEWGAGDFRGPLQYQDDDGFLERAAKSVGAFVTDTALDPLTYLTFGAGAVGKKVIQEGIEATAKLTAKSLDDDVATALAARAPIARQVREALEAGDRELAARRLSDVFETQMPMDLVPGSAANKRLQQDLASVSMDTDAEIVRSQIMKRAEESPLVAARVQVKPEDVEAALADPHFIRSLAGDTLTDEAVGAYTRRSARGLRNYLNSSELGERKAREFWKALPTGARGGLRFTIPFTKLETGSVLRPATIDRFGLGRVADAASAGSMRLRTTAPVQAVRRRMSGAAGDAYNEYLVKTARGGDASYTRDYSKLARTLRDNRAYRSDLTRSSVLVMQDLAGRVSSLEGDDAKIVESARRFLSEGTLRVPENATAIDKSGFEVAEAFRGVLEGRWKALKEAGLSINQVKEYWPRIASEDYLRGKAEKAPLRSGSKGTGVSGYRADKAREAFSTLIGQTDKGQLVFRWQSIDEANKLMTDEGLPAVFKTDPFEVLSTYLASTDRMLAASKLSENMQRAGILYSGPSDITRFLDGQAVADAVATGKKTLASFAGDANKPLTLEDASVNNLLNRTDSGLLDDIDVENLTPDEAAILQRAIAVVEDKFQVDELTSRLNYILGSDDDVLAYIRNAPVDDPRALNDYVGTLVLVLHDISELKRAQVDEVVKTLKAKGKDRLADKIRLAYADEIAGVTVSSLTQTKKTASNVDALLPDFGRLNAPVGNGKAPELSGLPASWEDETLVPDAIRRTVQQHFTRMPSRKFVDDFYAPFLTMWKLSATVGRGPGYIARNVVGAWWNNFLVGTNNRHYREAVRMWKARGRARRYADERMKSREGDASTWEDDYYTHFSKQVKGNQRLIAAERAWQASGMGNNNYNLEAMGVNLTEAATGSQVLDQAARGGRTRFTQGPATDLFSRSSNPNTRVKRGINKVANNPLYRVSGTAATASEDFVRTAAFLRGIDMYGLEDGGDAAASMVRATQFDYADLSPFERDVVRMLVPFYTWMRNNVPLQARALLTDPRKPLGAVRAQQELQAAFGYDYENNPDALPYDDLNPAYSVDRFGFAIDPKWTPDLLETGAGPLVLQMENPINDLNALIPRDPRNLEAWWDKGQKFALGALTPPLKVGGSLLSDVDISTGAPFNPKGVTAPSWANALGLSQQGITEGQVDEPRVDPRLAIPVRELLPPVSIFDRLYTGPGANEASQDRATSNWLSFFGAPVRTATEEQMGGVARQLYSDRQPEIEARGIELGVNTDELREFLVQFPVGPQRDLAVMKARQMMEQGYFKLEKPAE